MRLEGGEPITFQQGVIDRQGGGEEAKDLEQCAQRDSAPWPRQRLRRRAGLAVTGYEAGFVKSRFDQ